MPLDQLLAFLVHYRYVVIVPITIVEGPIIGVLVGFLATRGVFGLVTAYLILVISNQIGDIGWYLVGRLGRHPVIQRFGPLIGVTDPVILTLEQRFDRGAAKPLLWGKVAHGAGSLVILAAGVADVPFGEFFWWSLVGTLPKTLLFLGIGYEFGSAYQRIDTALGWVSLTVFAVVVLVAASTIRRLAASTTFTPERKSVPQPYKV